MSYSNAQTICSPEELALAASSGYYCFTREESISLVVRMLFESLRVRNLTAYRQQWLSVAGLVSMVAVVLIFGLITVSPYGSDAIEREPQNLHRREMSFVACVGPSRGS
jgi:hypothetical protein